MVYVKGFRGWVYNNTILDDFSLVVTPPNDVISETEKESYNLKSDFNFVKLIKPESYEAAKMLFDEWKQNDILVQDKQETIYIYSQEYCVEEKCWKRTGFMALIKLEELGKGVLPHEKILEKDLKDRISLISTTKANFGVPMVLYDDKDKDVDMLIEKETESKEPYVEFKEDDITHKLWKLEAKDAIKKIQDKMKDYQCIIADGHHRYTSALRVKELLGEQFSLICFVNSFNEGMTIFPTNRVIFDLDVDMVEFLAKLEQYFDIEDMDDIESLAKKVEQTEVLIDKQENKKNHVFGIYSNINDKGYLLKLKDNDVLKEDFPDKSIIYQRLDVNILHEIIIEKILGLTKEQQTNREHIDFVKGNAETVERMKDKKNTLALFVNPPLMREVFLTARAGEVMPQKSTFFYPKIYSGLVVYEFGENSLTSSNSGPPQDSTNSRLSHPN